MNEKRTAKTTRKIKNPKKNDKLVKIGLVVVIILFIIIIYKIFNATILTNENINLNGNTYYQYFYGIKEEYSGNMKVEQNDKDIQLILENGKTIYLDSTPLYYKDIMGKVLFAPQMELVIPDDGLYKISKFTNVIQENLKINLKKLNKKNETTINNGFLFDGNDLYFFFEQTTITVGGNDYTVSPLSYAIINYKDSAEIYDYDKDNYIVIQDADQLDTDVLAKNEIRNYTINMSVDSLITEKSQQLLSTNIDNLTEYNY